MSRKARICTISMNSLIHGTQSTREDRFREVEARMKRGSLDKPDLFLLPEHFLVNDAPDVHKDPGNVEEEGNEAYQRLGQSARTHNAYVAAALLTRFDGLLYNSIVLFDRTGEPVFTYHKAHPAPGEIDRGVTPGPRNPDCFDVDFGRIGLALCYDLNFQHLFRHYYDQGIELLLFSTYFPGGLMLQSWCHLYHFFAVSSHAQGYESVFIDNMGFETARADMYTLAMTRTIEFDVVVPRFDQKQILAAKEKYGPDLELDFHRPEGQVVLRYIGTETTVKDILREFDMQTRAEFLKNEHLL